MARLAHFCALIEIERWSRRPRSTHSVRQSKPVGRLAGLPVAVKDILCERGQTTTCASRMLENFRPPYDSTVIAKLREPVPCSSAGRTWTSSPWAARPRTLRFRRRGNPWDLERSPGGSSGGSAAAVAAGMAPRRSARTRAARFASRPGCVAIVGMKPTYGRVSRYGVVAFASSLDQVGPFGQSVEDVALLLETIAGHDPRDSTSLNVPVPPYSQTVNKPLANLRIGWVREHFGAGLDGEVEKAVRAALDVYKSLGATLHEISLPHSKYAVATYYVIAPSEASSNLARYDGVHFGYRTNEKEMLAELGG